MITMMYVIGKLARVHSLVTEKDVVPDCLLGLHGPWSDQCFYEAFVRIHVVGYLGLKQTQFLPPIPWWPLTAPTWNDTAGYCPGYPYRHR